MHYVGKYKKAAWFRALPDRVEQAHSAAVERIEHHLGEALPKERLELRFEDNTGLQQITESTRPHLLRIAPM